MLEGPAIRPAIPNVRCDVIWRSKSCASGSKTAALALWLEDRGIGPSVLSDDSWPAESKSRPAPLDVPIDRGGGGGGGGGGSSTDDTSTPAPAPSAGVRGPHPLPKRSKRQQQPDRCSADEVASETARPRARERRGTSVGLTSKIMAGSVVDQNTGTGMNTDRRVKDSEHHACVAVTVLLALLGVNVRDMMVDGDAGLATAPETWGVREASVPRKFVCLDHKLKNVTKLVTGGSKAAAGCAPCVVFGAVTVFHLLCLHFLRPMCYLFGLHCTVFLPALLTSACDVLSLLLAVCRLFCRRLLVFLCLLSPIFWACAAISFALEDL